MILTNGYWMVDYQSDGYWQEEYWLDYGLFGGVWGGIITWLSSMYKKLILRRQGRK